MLAPRKIKYRKPQKGRMTGLAKGGDYPASKAFKPCEPKAT
jgi:ribosomal protein L16/L10AE